MAQYAAEAEGKGRPVVSSPKCLLYTRFTWPYLLFGSTRNIVTCFRSNPIFDAFVFTFVLLCSPWPEPLPSATQCGESIEVSSGILFK